MNITLLGTALFWLGCTTSYAASNEPVTDINNAVQTTPVPATTTSNTTQTTLSTQPTPSATTEIPPPTSTSSTLGATVTSTTTTATPPTAIDCQYRIPAETTKIEPSLVSQWAVKATEQSFDFSASSLDNQLQTLKACYTEQGWAGFNDALQKSGNVNAIKSQQLMVSGQLDGEVIIHDAKENQWKVTLPLRVVYQNDKEKLTQLLTVDLLVGRKISGDLGIMQMIATPRQASPNKLNPTPSTEASQ